jgi:hypothetical protein
LTRTITLIALICCLLGGAAIVSILGRDSVPMATAEMIPAKAIAPVANRESKHDKLAVALQPAVPVEPAPAVNLSEPLRQAFASSNPSDTEAENAVAAAMPAVTGAVPQAAAKPKLVSKPAPPKNYSLLSDAQIAGIKERLHLTSDQEYYWPGIEQALRGIARKIQAARLSNPNANAGSIDPDSQEVQQLKSAAMPLLFQLRDDQKEEVRKLARVIGLEKVASSI